MGGFHRILKKTKGETFKVAKIEGDTLHTCEFSIFENVIVRIIE